MIQGHVVMTQKNHTNSAVEYGKEQWRNQDKNQICSITWSKNWGHTIYMFLFF